MQIGFVGLGKMGGNMAHRILRDSDHEVVGWNLTPDEIRKAEIEASVEVTFKRP